MTDEDILLKAPKLGPGGSTAVTAILIDSKDLYVANVGDSRAVISKAGKAEQMSVDHEPGNEAEKGKIEEKGGFVSNMPGTSLELVFIILVRSQVFNGKTEGCRLSQSMISPMD